MSKKKRHKRTKNPGEKLVAEMLAPKKEHSGSSSTEASPNHQLAHGKKQVRRIFFIVESILFGLVLFGTLALIYTVNITKADPRTCLQQNPHLALDLIFLCIQLIVAWTVSRTHARLKEQEVESVISIVGILLCTECILRSPVGIFCFAIMLWKIARIYHYDFSQWLARRGLLGVLGVLSQALLASVIAILHALFSLKLG